MEEEEDERYKQALEHKLASSEPDSRHDICPKFYTTEFSRQKFYTTEVRNLRRYDSTAEMHFISVMWAFLLELS